jgi:hypothetical protein
VLEWALNEVVVRSGGLASGGDGLTFAGDLVFAPGFDHPDWYNGFEHDPEEAARVRGCGASSRANPMTRQARLPSAALRWVSA